APKRRPSATPGNRLALRSVSCYSKAMQIEFKTEGGMAYFPGLSKPVVIDSDDLPEKEAKELRRQVAEAHFFSLPTRTGELLPGAADYQTYTITVKDGKKRH